MRIVFTHVCVLPQSGLEATDCFVEALLCLVPGRCRSVRAVVVAPSWSSVLAGRLTLDLLEYRSHAAPEWRGGGPCETTRRRGAREGQPAPLHAGHDATHLLAFRAIYGRRAGSLSASR